MIVVTWWWLPLGGFDIAVLAFAAGILWQIKRQRRTDLDSERKVDQ